MTLLPIPSSRASRRAFWLIASAAAGVALGLVLLLLGTTGAGGALLVALLAGGAVALAGVLLHHEVALPYRAWNGLVRVSAAGATRWVTVVCFWTILQVLALGRPGRRFERSPANGSTWRSRGMLAPGAYRDTYGVRVPGGGEESTAAAGEHWLRALSGWMRAEGPAGARALLPFLALLRFLDTGDRRSEGPSSNVYTLY